jgi:predicted ATPase
VLAIDDLQWLDPSSTRVIGFALRRLADRPIGLLATQRDTFSAEVLRAALPPARISLLDVGPLTEDETDELIRVRMGAALLRPLVGQIYHTAAGNPLFSLELARVVLQQTKPLPVGVPLPLPNTLEEVIGRRVSAVSATTRDVLLVVAASGTATVNIVEQTLGHAALAGVQRAIDAGLLESERGQLRFTHPLLAAASYSSAEVARRRRVHLRLASVTIDVEEHARQLSAATDLPDHHVADQLEKGAAAAYVRGAPNEAGALAERALQLTPGSDRTALLRRTMAAADYFWEAGDSERPLPRCEDWSTICLRAQTGHSCCAALRRSPRIPTRSRPRQRYSTPRSPNQTTTQY